MQFGNYQLSCLVRVLVSLVTKRGAVRACQIKIVYVTKYHQALLEY